MNKHANEVKAIHTLRDRFPGVGQMTLAKKITSNNFAGSESLSLANTATCFGVRPMLSVYSVIRRYDAKRAATVAN